MELTHLNAKGYARMVDISNKEPTERYALAKSEVHMSPQTIKAIKEGRIAKGDVLAVAQIAGIEGAKRTSTLIPMCHNINLTHADIVFEIKDYGLEIFAIVKCIGSTGVEMEALTAASTAALTVYDMIKAADKNMTITNIMLLEKRGGKSGDYVR